MNPTDELPDSTTPPPSETPAPRPAMPRPLWVQLFRLRPMILGISLGLLVSANILNLSTLSRQNVLLRDLIRTVDLQRYALDKSSKQLAQDRRVMESDQRVMQSESEELSRAKVLVEEADSVCKKYVLKLPAAWAKMSSAK